MVQEERIRRIVTPLPPTMSPGPVVCALGRDFRLNDNDALHHAQTLALTFQKPLIVTVCLWPKHTGATRRMYNYHLQALKELESGLRKLSVALIILHGKEDDALYELLCKTKAFHLVTDVLPLRFSKRWKARLAQRLHKINTPWDEVDTHNVVPVWEASTKAEFAARTIRPKLFHKLAHFLVPHEKITAMPHTLSSLEHPAILWHTISPECDESVGEIVSVKVGESAALIQLQHFLSEGLKGYALRRNIIHENRQSGLSVYISRGSLSRRRILLELEKHLGSKLALHIEPSKNGSGSDQTDISAFIEECFIRAELAENFCFYNDNYDNFNGFPSWAKETLTQARGDSRDYIYTRDELATAKTHDELWNAAQRELLTTGKMHGYMRMYWAKKILEWTESPEEAMHIAVDLNDTYELDGCDPNGYVGCAWAIGGLHDRPWFRRPVFGTVRYMTSHAVKKHGSIEAYIAKY